MTVGDTATWRGSDKSFRLLVVGQEVDDPATRYRVNLYVPLLKARGVTTTFRSWPRKFQARQSIVREMSGYDAVVIQRRLISLGWLRLVRLAAKRLAFDFDDAIKYADSAGQKPRLSLRQAVRFRSVIHSADAVTCGNEYLRSMVGPTGSRPAEIVPTVVPLERYAGLPLARSADSFVVGWIGQRSTLPYLEQIGPALQRLVQMDPNITVRCISDSAPKIPGVPIELVEWTDASEVKEIQKLDVGLAPLPDDVWTRGKCGLRMLQYLAAGVPCVASPVGVQARISKDADLPAASSMDEWVEALHSLMSDRVGAVERAARGRKLVEREFAPSLYVDRIMDNWCGISGYGETTGHGSL